MINTKRYKYELHSHTSRVSICSTVSGAKLARLYKNYGCEALCLTDHFFNGNTNISFDIPWKRRVELFCEGYEEAFREGEKIGIKVFFGWEYSYRGTDYLTYGLDKYWLLQNEKCLDLSVKDYCELVRNDGGYIVHAHPFREADYIDMIRLNPHDVDAVEVYNANRLPAENEKAQWYANEYKLTKLCGSDIHSEHQKNFGFLSSDICHNDIHSLIKEMKSGKMEITQITLPEEMQV